MMILRQNKFILPAMVCLAFFCQSNNTMAVSLKDLTKDKSSVDRNNKPTKIVSDSMDIDFQNNVATLTGNVDVDDPAVRIKCDKMMIYLQEKEAEEKPQTGKDKEKVKEQDDSSANMTTGGNKELKKIVCIGNVIIHRKLYDKDDVSLGEQKATAGNAVFHVKENMIVLTEDNPSIMRGKDTLRGNKITLWLDSERLKVESATGETGGQRAEINVENIKALQKGADKK